MNNIATFFSKRVYLVIVLLIILFAVISNYNWIKRDNSVAGVDSQNHLLFSVEFFYDFSDVIHSNTPALIKIINIVKLLGKPVAFSSVYWPNGLNLTAAIVYSFLGNSLFSAKLSLLLYLFILLFSVYTIGKFSYSDFVGTFAVFFVFMYPVIFQSSRQYQLDFPLTAMTTLTIYFLLRCNNFKDRKYSFLLGFSLGWAMLIKGQVVIFVATPILLILYKTFKESKKEMLIHPLRSQQFYNLIILLIVAGLIASIWWGHQISDAIARLKEHIFSSQKSLENIIPWDKKYSLRSIFFHLQALFYSSLRPFFFLVFSISFFIFLKRKSKYKEIYLSWLIIPFLLFSLVFTIKHSRFLMPILPAMAIITAVGLEWIKNNSPKIFLVLFTIIVIFSFGQFWVLSYRDYDCRSFSIGGFKIFGENMCGADYETPPPHIADFKIKEILKAIRNSTKKDSIKIGSINLAGNPNTFEMIYRLKTKDRFVEAYDLTEMSWPFFRNFRWLDFILVSAYTKDPLIWPGGENFRRILESRHYTKIRSFVGKEKALFEKLLDILEVSKPCFKLLNKIYREDNIVYYIYKRINNCWF